MRISPGWRVILPALCSLAIHSHASSIPSPTPSRRAGPAFERTITVVTDRLDENCLEGRARKILCPAHAWVLFSATPNEGAVRVELVAPILESIPLQLAIAVTEYTERRIDLGEPNYMYLSNDTKRTSYKARIPTPLTNEMIFDPTFNASQHGRPSAGYPDLSLVEHLFVMNAMFTDNLDVLFGDRFQDSLDFVVLLLGELQRRYGLESTDYFAEQATNIILNEGAEWSGQERVRNGRESFEATDVDYLFFEAPKPTRGLKGQTPSAVRQLYDLNKSRYRKYRQRKIDWGWSYFKITDLQGHTRRKAPVLVRDPRLTSDVLPLGSQAHIYKSRDELVILCGPPEDMAVIEGETCPPDHPATRQRPPTWEWFWNKAMGRG